MFQKWQLYVFRIANKQDKKETLNKAEVVEELHLEGLVNKYECPCNIVSSCLPFQKLLSMVVVVVGGIFKSSQDHSRVGLSLHQIAYSALPGYIGIANKMMKGGQKWLFNILDLNYDFIKYRMLNDMSIRDVQRDSYAKTFDF